jgi:hypothetical protein
VFFIIRTHHTLPVHRIGSVFWAITTGRVQELR